jgi:hypothetical protein
VTSLLCADVLSCTGACPRPRRRRSPRAAAARLRSSTWASSPVFQIRGEASWQFPSSFRQLHSSRHADEAQHKLELLGEYITDSEDFVNINMDAVRNRLIKWEIVIDTATFALGIYAVVAGVLGENLVIAPQRVTKSQEGYIIVNVGMLLFCFAVFGVIMLQARRRGLV